MKIFKSVTLSLALYRCITLVVQRPFNHRPGIPWPILSPQQLSLNLSRIFLQDSKVVISQALVGLGSGERLQHIHQNIR